MKFESLSEYLRHYGKIRSLRGSVVRSTFKRVIAAYDEYDPIAVKNAMQELHQPLEGPLNCVYCGTPATCWDHLIPAARGGTHQLRNFAPSCTRCNNAKGNKSWEEYLSNFNGKTANAEATLKQYTASYCAAPPIVNEDEQRQLDDILAKIHKCMDEADEIVEKACHRNMHLRGQPGNS
ncbi:MAG: HNH endonuclease [Sulfuricellaceae bacterium]